ncbi:hypothetical protein WMY93_016672 [Mugilogobius chulae]|uniref:Reverse transcriptase domain-containing protein n=1 Tax=Mugilogobius chulae TaxID=88201 RepID=A0AAW0NKX9_9GOBI
MKGRTGAVRAAGEERLHHSDYQHRISTGLCTFSPALLPVHQLLHLIKIKKLIKFADDTTLIGLISDGDESVYRREVDRLVCWREVDRLVSWCSSNNLELNAQKTVEMIVDFRKVTAPPQLKKAKLPVQMMVQFYTATIESILTSSITVWYAGATVRDKQTFHLSRTCTSPGPVRLQDSGASPGPVRLQDLYVSRTCTSPGPVRLQDLCVSRTCTSPGPVRLQDLYVSRTCTPPEPVRLQDLYVSRTRGRLQDLYVSRTYASPGPVRLQDLYVSKT